MTVIEASSVGVKTMADGTLRITLDIEPRHSKDAFNLFGAPGTPCALAALKCATQEPANASSGSRDPGPTTPDVAHLSPKGGELAKLAGIWCRDLSFREWLAAYHPYIWRIRSTGHLASGPNLKPEEIARDVVCDVCQVQSRAELDHVSHGADAFQAFIRGPYMKHQLARGVTT